MRNASQPRSVSLRFHQLKGRFDPLGSKLRANFKLEQQLIRFI